MSWVLNPALIYFNTPQESLKDYMSVFIFVGYMQNTVAELGILVWFMGQRLTDLLEFITSSMRYIYYYDL